MAYFRVGFQGKGIRLPFDDEDPAIGFFTTRVVNANSPDDAADVARSYLPNGAMAEHMRPSIPAKSPDSLSNLSWGWGWFGASSGENQPDTRSIAMRTSRLHADL